LILLTGATGYVGGHLLAALEQQGRRVRCLVRDPARLKGEHLSTTEIVAGDVLDRESLKEALCNVHAAYYLIHSMAAPGSFEDKDRQAAQNFGELAAASGVQRIIYHGGLGDEQQELSAHLRSRHEVGRILGQSGVQVIEFRASIVIGAGSLSFEMIRALVDRLPVMVTPKWVSMIAQPIAIDDLIAYLIAGLDASGSASKIYEIGGADQVSYEQIMRVYARRRRKRRWMIRVPVLTPYLSSLWLGLVTPLYARVGRKLIESIVHSTVVNNDCALKQFSITPMGIEDSVTRALGDPTQPHHEAAGANRSV